jgi:CRP-like cAMP-binding protein
MPPRYTDRNEDAGFAARDQSLRRKRGQAEYYQHHDQAADRGNPPQADDLEVLVRGERPLVAEAEVDERHVPGRWLHGSHIGRNGLAREPAAIALRHTRDQHVVVSLDVFDDDGTFLVEADVARGSGEVLDLCSRRRLSQESIAQIEAFLTAADQSVRAALSL